MALAYLKYDNISDSRFHFKADIGSSHFYQYKIGRKKRGINGLSIVEDVSFISPVLRNPNSFDGSFEICIDQSRFQNGNKLVQLWSYRDSDLTGPSISEPIFIHVELGGNSVGMNLYSSESFSHMETFNRRNKELGYRERGVSEALFWSQLISALPRLVEQVVPAVQQLIGGTRVGAPSATDVINSVAEIIRQVAQPPSAATPVQQAPARQGTTGGAPGAATGETPVQAATEPVSQASSWGGLSMSMQQIIDQTISQDSYELIKDDPERLGKTLNDSILRLCNRPRANYQYSEAKVAPAIGAIVSAVAPYVRDILNLGNEDEKNKREHLERLVALLNNPNIVPLLATMSLSQSNEIRFIPSRKIFIDTSNLEKTYLNNNYRVVYSSTGKIVIPFQIITRQSTPLNRPIPQAVIQVCMQDPDDLSVLFKRRYMIKDVYLNTVQESIVIPESEVRLLPLNKDIKVEITFLWKSIKTKKTYGIIKNQFIFLSGEYIFDQIGERIGEPIPLNDIIRHRQFWHKVWEGSLSEHSRWSFDVNMKYYYALSLNDTHPSQFPTEWKIIEDNADENNRSTEARKVKGKMRSGLEISIEMLNDLLLTLSTETLEFDKLQGLKNPALQKYFNQVAHVNFEMKGKNGRTGTIWTYPEASIHQVHMLRVKGVNTYGQVISTEKEIIRFPRPSAIHFIGTTTDK